MTRLLPVSGHSGWCQSDWGTGETARERRHGSSPERCSALWTVPLPSPHTGSFWKDYTGSIKLCPRSFSLSPNAFVKHRYLKQHLYCYCRWYYQLQTSCLLSSSSFYTSGHDMKLLFSKPTPWGQRWCTDGHGSGSAPSCGPRWPHRARPSFGAAPEFPPLPSSHLQTCWLVGLGFMDSNCLGLYARDGRE